eukprot:3160361-Lingulodinium_polyedra.AAC.1
MEGPPSSLFGAAPGPPSRSPLARPPRSLRRSEYPGRGAFSPPRALISGPSRCCPGAPATRGARREQEED